ncbi:MAG: hypothetical protein K9G67_05950 [Bacteroidales bacterium]|nr:hypothetical protein [Bacteroidales bacterium]MCF8351056.1 hypothetical protein [Bacteroidales bacterium]MCF8375878.1 hypothetical protein [Bacteroidales bacterium]
MNTIKISVKSGKDANLLIRLLKSLNFVSSVEQIDEKNSRQSLNHYDQLQKTLDKLNQEELFSGIDNPDHWQKEQRNEWN